MTKMMSEYLVHEAVDKGKLKWDSKKLKFLNMHIRFQDRSLSNVPFKMVALIRSKTMWAMGNYSANGATIALAEEIAGKEVDSVKMMNDK